MSNEQSPPESQAMVEIVKVSKTYPPDVLALDNVSLVVNRGGLVFLTGVSGAGKTTLLKLLCFLELPTKGVIEIDGRDVSTLSKSQIQMLRQQIGVAYQDFRLLPRQTVYQNIALAMEVRYESPKVVKKRVLELLAKLGLADKVHTPANKLSRGEQQRVSIARACANKPSLLLADEPTGNLDPSASALVMDLFNSLTESGSTIIIATHDEALIKESGQRVVNIEQGRLQEILQVKFEGFD
ncbi:MAG: cell division ATP-binding protein FtsE [Thermodesulfobacteriota bacterium]